jgi:hypothetical protein
MKAIPICWFWASPDEGYSNLLILSVTRWRLFQSVDIERHQMKVIPICWYWASPDDGYSNLLILSVTRWRLFQSVDIERHQMKVIPIYWYWASPDEGYSRNSSCALNLISTFFITNSMYIFILLYNVHVYMLFYYDLRIWPPIISLTY